MLVTFPNDNKVGQCHQKVMSGSVRYILLVYIYLSGSLSPESDEWVSEIYQSGSVSPESDEWVSEIYK